MKKRVALICTLAGCFSLYIKSASNTAEIFAQIFTHNGWHNTESVSGPGSTLEQTRVVREELPGLFREFEIESMLDIPCGDLNWMREVNLSSLKLYIGADIVVELIRNNILKFGQNDRSSFIVADIINDRLPKVDLVFCRDCLVHLSHQDGLKAIKNIKLSGAKYLFATTFPNTRNNRRIKTGDWFPFNLEIAPFNFPKPIKLIIEGCTHNPKYPDKSMGLWSVADLVN